MDQFGTLEVFGQPVDFSGYKATVMDIQPWTETHVSFSGGGGYVHPSYGGWVQAPTIRSRTSRHQRVRFKFDHNDQQSGADLPGSVHLSRGDKVVLIAAESKASKKWYWAGIGNATTREVSTLAPAAPIIDMRMPSLLARYGLFIQRCVISGPSGVFMLIPGLAIATLIFRYLLVTFLLTRHADRDFATFLGFVLAIIIHVLAWRRTSAAIRKEGDACTVKVHGCLQAMLASNRT
jgi:hypothetical protein